MTAALALAGRSREVVIAVDPFEMQAAVFRVVDGLFAQYTAWTAESWLLTVAWLGLGGLALAAWVTLGGLRGARDHPTQPAEGARSGGRSSEQSERRQRLAVDFRDGG